MSNKLRISRDSVLVTETNRRIRKAQELMETYPVGVPAISVHYLPDSILKVLEEDGVFIEAVRLDTTIPYLVTLIQSFDQDKTLTEYKGVTEQDARTALYFLREAEKQGAVYAVFVMS